MFLSSGLSQDEFSVVPTRSAETNNQFWDSMSKVGIVSHYYMDAELQGTLAQLKYQHVNSHLFFQQNMAGILSKNS